MTPTSGPAQISTGGLDGGWATVIAAGVAALVAVIGYALTQAAARRERNRRAYGEALAAVMDYLEAPYRVRRRPASDPRTRYEITSAISEIQSRIRLHAAWLAVTSPRVSRAYNDLVVAARVEAGAHMTAAWSERAFTRDSQMALKIRYEHPQADAARDRCLAAMRRELRWIRVGR